MRILITGATGGIGKEITKHLAQNHDVIACGHSNLHLRQLEQFVHSKTLLTKKVNLKRTSDIQKLISDFNQLDILINCAAILPPVGLFGENDLTKWIENIEVNLLGTVKMCHTTLPLLLKSTHGKIINFSGGGGAFARTHHTAYATSKTAVIRFTETLAVEYPQLDINVIAPGAYKTPMWKQETHDKEPEKWGDMDKLLEFIDFLISEKSNGITGRFLNYKDDWQNIKTPTEQNLYTLRRIDNYMFTTVKSNS